jgi:ABC-type nitrate/sulfonate/bicarbonate transport system substrate-binding protein
MGKMSRRLGAGLILTSVLLAGSPAGAAERITIGVTGTPNALAWPFYIAIEKGFFATGSRTGMSIWSSPGRPLPG